MDNYILNYSLFGLSICPSVSIEKSVSRVGAKSLYSFWRAISFKLYFVLNEYKQAVESAVKSILFKIRKHRWERLYACFIQRSSIGSFYNVIILFLCLHGFCDLITIKFLKLWEYTILFGDISIFCSLVYYLSLFCFVIFLIFYLQNTWIC